MPLIRQRFFFSSLFSLDFRVFLFSSFFLIFFVFFWLQEVLENVENLVPSHFVDAFDGNDVPFNGVLENVGHDFSVTQKDPLDGALTQDLLDGPLFFWLCHMLLLLTLFLHNKFRFLLVLLGLKFYGGDL